MTHVYLGVDLSADRLEVCDPRRLAAREYPNTTVGIRALLKVCGAGTVLTFEATSGCDRPLMEACAKADQAYVRLNPLHVWHFIQSLNAPKTDRKDADNLALFGAQRQPAPRLPPPPVRETLTELVSRRDQLKRMETQEKNRLRKAELPLVRTQIAAMLAALAAQVKRIDAAIAEVVAADPTLSRDAELLRSIDGIGPVISAGLLARLPELGTLDRRTTASLAGLAPKAHESGKFRGKRRIGQGRNAVRSWFYMASVSLWRARSDTDATIRKMIAAGKPKKVILVAIARKIATIANAVIRDQTPFRATPQT